MRNELDAIDAESKWLWPNVLTPIAFAFMLPLAVIELQDAITRGMLHRLTNQDALYPVLHLWLPGLCLAVGALLLGLQGTRGIYVAVVGMVIALYAVNHFRSEWIRPGTFEFYDEPSKGWLVPMLSAFGLGNVAGWLLTLAKKTAPLPPPMISALVLLLAGLDSWRLVTWHPTASWSAWPPTRHLLLLGLGATFLVICTLDRFIWSRPCVATHSHS